MSYRDDDSDYGDVPDVSNGALKLMLAQQSELTVAKPVADRDSFDAMYGDHPNQKKKVSPRPQSKLSNPNKQLPPKPKPKPNPRINKQLAQLGNRNQINTHNLASRKNRRLSNKPENEKFSIRDSVTSPIQAAADNQNPNLPPNLRMNNSNSNKSNNKNTNNNNNQNQQIKGFPMIIAAAKPLQVKNDVKVTPIHKSPNNQNRNQNYSIPIHRNNQNNQNNQNQHRNNRITSNDTINSTNIPSLPDTESSVRSDNYDNGHRDTQISMISSQGGYWRDSTISRESTTYYLQKKMKAEPSFRKINIIPSGSETLSDKGSIDNGRIGGTNHKKEQPKSALSAAIQQQHGGNDNENNGSSQQFKDKHGNLVIQQIPFNKSKMFKCNLYVEIDDDETISCIVFFDKTFTGSEFINFIKTEWNHGALISANISLLVADEDGDIDDDFPAPEAKQVLSKMGLEHFYIKIENIDTDKRKTIALENRQSIKRLNSWDEDDDMNGTLPRPTELSPQSSMDARIKEQTNKHRAPDGCCVVM